MSKSSALQKAGDGLGFLFCAVHMLKKLAFRTCLVDIKSPVYIMSTKINGTQMIVHLLIPSLSKRPEIGLFRRQGNLVLNEQFGLC